MTKLDQLMKEAEALSRDDREFLAVRLLQSIEDERDEGYEEAWAAEIERRMREVDEGRVTPLPLDEVLQRLRDERG